MAAISIFAHLDLAFARFQESLPSVALASRV
jgi:hypothetical protein